MIKIIIAYSDNRAKKLNGDQMRVPKVHPRDLKINEFIYLGGGLGGC